ncbi:hypothetical protein ACPOL_3097 [Acidisarcina polymorpha]|uniref:Uncharacterized protein n=1 Tax=Acidisarcina polymorpha TaxID=2211140 RepID=A0A2Z5FZY2_9BACT|nr:hypothetical protein ACPOL_3097 [Acidisarcina polymorpha]
MACQCFTFTARPHLVLNLQCLEMNWLQPVSVSLRRTDRGLAVLTGKRPGRLPIGRKIPLTSLII